MTTNSPSGFRLPSLPTVLVAVLGFAPMAHAVQVSVTQRSETVNRWGRFEAVLANTNRYADPYRDVRLDAVFRDAQDRPHRVMGFYDGGQSWRVRFRPDQSGRWTYQLAFSDGSGQAHGTFQVRTTTSPFGPLMVNPVNPIWFSRGGKPFFVRAFHVGDRFFARNWSGDRRNKFLDWFQTQGYNTISVASHYLNRQVEGRGKGWDTPRLWPLNPAQYQQMEAILNDLEQRGIVVFPFAGFFGKDSDYPRARDDQALYLAYTMARIGHYGNLMYNVAGPEPNLKDHWLPTEDVVRLGRFIRDTDPYAHPLTVHNRTGNDPYRDSDWTSFGTLQGPKTLNRAKLNQGLRENHHSKKPLFAQETLWSGNQFHIGRNGQDYSDDDLRKHAYVIAMSGASFCFADNQGNSSSGFTGTLARQDCTQARHDVIKRVWDFIESTPFTEMTPAQELVDRGFCLANPGLRYLVYLESRGNVRVKVTGGPYTVTWIDARRPNNRQSAGVTRDGQNLQSPSHGDDWLLELKRRSDLSPR